MKVYRKLNSARGGIALCSLVLLIAPPLARQASAKRRCGVVGTVLDTSRATVQQAALTVRNIGDNTNLSITSDDAGAYQALDLKPGMYEIAARKAGFAPSIAKVILTEGTVPRVDLELTRVIAAGGAQASALAITEELAAMKERIAQLEAELKKTRQQEASAVAPEPLKDPRVMAANRPAPLVAPPAQALAPQTEAPGAVQAAVASPPSKAEPFAYADWTWLNGTARTKDVPFDSKWFTPEVRFDTHYMVSFNQPKDDSLGGSTEMFRSNEVQVEQISVGGDFHWQNVRGRILTMFGMFAQTTPRNDASPGRGQWDLRTPYRYVSEAYGGYHFNVNHGLNVDAGIFVSYIGLFSYYNFDNWAYQPSYVSSNTPWFFNGVRAQWFPTDKLKIEPWFINGWQSYGRLGSRPGLGGQILYRPKPWLSMVFNNYGMGEDTLGLIGRSRIHTDDSVTVRYYNKPEYKGISKMAFSLTGDAGCEYGGGVSCRGGNQPRQSFIGWMGYNRIWFNKDRYAVTLGGGQMNNKGRYLTLLPPINGADAISGSPYFTQSPGDKAHMWDSSATFDYMPKQYITFRWEAGYRHSDVPYFTGRGGITPPGGNNGHPSQFVCNDGSPTSDPAGCGPVGLWKPDLRRSQAHLIMSILVKF